MFVSECFECAVAVLLWDFYIGPFRSVFSLRVHENYCISGYDTA